jgi:predicted metalloprotease
MGAFRLRVASLVVLAAGLGMACSDSGTDPRTSEPERTREQVQDADADGVADDSDECADGAEDDGRWGSDANDGCPGTLEDLLTLATDDINGFWAEQFEEASSIYEPPLKVAGYTSPIETACGQSAPQNAFYCSADHSIYFDEAFLGEELETNGDFGPVLIMAHEWGHLIQAIVGQLQSSTVLSIELELQADCLAGVWSADADRRRALEEGDLEEAMTILYKGGDPEARPFDPSAHGTSEQRISAFRAGFDEGLEACSLA